MADVVISPNMLLPVPVVGVEPGPQFAIDINACLQLLDEHNHSSGKGVPISPNGLNINDDLPFNDNNATELRSLRFEDQVSALSDMADISCLYSVTGGTNGSNLYFNTGDGTQVPIVVNGGVAGAPGNITGLVSPASASYVSGSQTFVFESQANQAANIDVASITLRAPIPNSPGITINAASPVPADYNLVLPGSLPSSDAAVVVSPAGNVAYSIGAFMPTGAVIPYAGASAPAGFLIADGAAVSRTTYAALFGIIGTTFGVGDGSTTFNIPSLVQRFPFGANGTYPRGSVGGNILINPTTNQLPAHSHNITDPGHAHDLRAGNGSAGAEDRLTVNNAAGGAFVTIPPGASQGVVTATTGITITDTTGDGDPINILNPYLALNYIIKV